LLHLPPTLHPGQDDQVPLASRSLCPPLPHSPPFSFISFHRQQRLLLPRFAPPLPQHALPEPSLISPFCSAFSFLRLPAFRPGVGAPRCEEMCFATVFFTRLRRCSGLQRLAHVDRRIGLQASFPADRLSSSPPSPLPFFPTSLPCRGSSHSRDLSADKLIFRNFFGSPMPYILIWPSFDRRNPSLTGGFLPAFVSDFPPSPLFPFPL